MGLCKWILKRITCKSNCSFNNDKFDIEIFSTNLNEFQLKNKDMIRIGSILRKREKKCRNNITDI